MDPPRFRAAVAPWAVALGALLPAGCKPPPPPPPPPPPTGMFTKAEIVMAAEEALTENDIALMLRANVDQETIVADIRRRGLVERVGDDGCRRLAEIGARAELRQAAQDWRSVLTDGERGRYRQRAGLRPEMRAAAVLEIERRQDEERRAAAEKLRQQQAILDSALQDARKDRRQQERARAMYEQTKAAIERQIEEERRYIRDLLRDGGKDTDWRVRDAKQRIADLERQERDLRWVPGPAGN